MRERDDHGRRGEGSIVEQLEVLGAEFAPAAEGAVRVSVLAHGVLNRAMPLLARVGDQPLRDLTVGPHGFSGSLASGPRAGDRLYVRYADTDEMETAVVYRGTGVAG